MKDSEIMLDALRKQREELHQKILQLDRIIKRVKSGEYLGKVKDLPDSETPNNSTPNASSDADSFPKNAEVKVQVLKVFDLLQKASKLTDLQAEYNKLNGRHYPIRETIRSLNRSKLLVQIREKSATRGFLWVKTEWVANGQLLNEYKPEGFDMLYKPENLEYE